MEARGLTSESEHSQPSATGRTTPWPRIPFERNTYRYNAFISYSHAADGKLAPALRDALHTFARPWNRLRALNVFQDTANLAANPALWTSVAQALAQSEFFVLMASPDASRSAWVNKELEWWLEKHSSERIFIVQTAGDIVWDQTAHDFDWGSSTALPERLRKKFSEEPRHVDLRWAHTATDLSLSNPAFRAAVIDIAAPLHKRGKDELIGHDVEEQRRRSTIRRRVIFALSVSLVIAVVSAIFAMRQRNIAEIQRDEARRQRDLAISRQLAAQASLLADTGQDEAVIERAAAFAIESWRRRKSALAAEAAARLLPMLPETRLETGDEGWNAALSADGRYLVTVNAKAARVLDTRRGGEVARIQMRGRELSTPNALAISDNGRIAAFGSPDGTTHVVRTADGGSKVFTIGYQPRFNGGGGVSVLALSANGRFLAIAHADGRSRMIELGQNAEVLRIEDEPGWVADAITVSANGQYIAIGSGSDRSTRILLVDSASHRTISRLRIENGGSINAWAFSPNGTYLAVAIQGNKALLLNTRNAEKVIEFAYEASAKRVAFSPDSRLLAIGGSDETMRMIETATATEVARIQHPAQVFALAFSHRGDLIATGTDSSVASLIDVPSGKVVARVPHDSTVTALAFSADDRQLVARNFDGKVFITETAHPGRAFEIRHGNDPVNVMALSPNGRWLVTGGRDGTARLVEIASRREVARIRHSIDRTDPYVYRGVNDIAFSGDSRYLATAGTDGVVVVVETASGAVVTRVASSEIKNPQLKESVFRLVQAIAFSPDGSLLAVAKSDVDKSTTRVVEVSSGREKIRFENNGRVGAVLFSPDGRLLAMWSDTEGRLSKIADGKDVARLGLGFSSEKVLAFSPGGQYLVTAGGEYQKSGVLHVVAVTDGSAISREIHRDTISAIAFNPSGQLIATASFDGTVRLFEIESGREIDRIKHVDRVRAVEFSPDGRFLATAGSDGVVTLTTIASKTRVVRHVHGSGISTIAFSHDGRWLATGSWDGTARLIEADGGTELARIAHGALVHTVAFTPDGQFVATASRDGTAALHWADPQRLFDLLCKKAGRNLSRAEWEETFGMDDPWKPTCDTWRKSEH